MIQRGHRDTAGGDFDEVAVGHVFPVGVVVIGFAGQHHAVRAAQDGQRVPQAVASMQEPLAANTFNRARGSAAAISTTVSPSASRPRSKMTAASIALSQTDSACDVAGSAARSTTPLCDNNHRPSVNGAVALMSIGMPTVAERTAATTQWLRSAGATDSNDASPHSGSWLRQRGAAPSEEPPEAASKIRRPNRPRSAGNAFAGAAHRPAPAARTAGRAPARRP